MFPPIFRVFLDTNVLFPSALRDTLLRAAETGLVQAYWSEDVLTELERNLVRTARYTPTAASRLVQIIRTFFSASEVTGYRPLIPSMPNHPDVREYLLEDAERRRAGLAQE